VERLIRYFVERPMLVHVLVVVVVAVGLVQTRRAPQETFPNATIPKLFVNGMLPGASARDVETKIAIPIQDAIEELNGVVKFVAVVSDGSSRTEIDLYDDFEDARVREAERDLRVLIDGVKDFPPEMDDAPTIQRLNPQLFPVAQVALAGPTLALVDVAQDLERRIRAMDEVSSVALIGLGDPEVRILVDPIRARENGVTLAEVVDAIRRRNVSATGGILESERDRRQVVMWSRFGEPEEVAQTVIRAGPRGLLTVGDVARIEVGREDLGLLVHTNAEPGLVLSVRKQEDADIVDTVDALNALVSATPMPEGVSWALVRDESFMARNRLQLMWNNGVLGLLLVAVVLFVFLTPVAAGWTLAGIPIVFLGTLALFPVFGFALNMVTLTGLVVVLGMVVDDAIVVSERIVSRRQEGEEAHDAAVRGAAEMVRPVTASALTTMLAFMPMWGLGGMNGRFVEALPAVVILALGLSVLESFVILPSHLATGAKRPAGRKRRLVVRMEEIYRGLLERALHHRFALVAGFSVALLTIFTVIAPSMPVMLYPQDDAQAFHAKVTLPLGTPIERTEAIVTSLERQFAPRMGGDLLALTTRIGLKDPEAFETTRGSAENEAVITAVVQPVGREKTAGQWVEILERELVAPPEAGILYEVEYMGPPVGRPVTIHVASDADEVRRGTAIEIASWLREQGGLVAVEIDERPGTPQIELVLDYDRLARRGLDPEEVARTIQIAFFGIAATEHRALHDTTDFRVMLPPDARRSLDELLEIPVRARSGELVQLRDVATPIEVPGVSRIYHRNGQRTATVSASFTLGSEHTALSFAQLVEGEVLPRYAGLAGLAVSVGGEAVETRRTTGDIGIVAMLAFGGIGLVIALMLGSFLEAAFVVAVIPFSIGGVILAFFLHGQPLSIFAMIGSIGLAGVVVNASIVMVDAVHRRVKEAEDPAARKEALIDAVVSRLRPIVVTTLTTLGGVLPMAYGIGGRDAVVAPMSLAIGWGLLLSTGVTLFLVPTLYTLASDVRGLRVAGLWERLRRRPERPASPARAAADRGFPPIGRGAS
jgi:multidrug efflux pump subunit AcrB